MIARGQVELAQVDDELAGAEPVAVLELGQRAGRSSRSPNPPLRSIPAADTKASGRAIASAGSTSQRAPPTNAAATRPAPAAITIAAVTTPPPRPLAKKLATAIAQQPTMSATPRAARRTTVAGLPLGRSPETNHQTARPASARKPSGASAPPRAKPNPPPMTMQTATKAATRPIATLRSRGDDTPAMAVSSSSGTSSSAAA